MILQPCHSWDTFYFTLPLFVFGHVTVDTGYIGHLFARPYYLKHSWCILQRFPHHPPCQLLELIFIQNALLCKYVPSLLHICLCTQNLMCFVISDGNLPSPMYMAKGSNGNMHCFGSTSPAKSQTTPLARPSHRRSSE